MVLSTVCRFVYGTSRGAYTDIVTADRSPLTRWTAVSISKGITGLTSGRIYYFQAVASNSSYYVRGNELTFAVGALGFDRIIEEQTWLLKGCGIVEWLEKDS